MHYKAVIFDLDGTLLDTIEDIADSMNAALEKSGYAGHSIEEYKSYIGDGIEILARRSLPVALRDEDAVLSCVEAMRDEYARRWQVKSRPFENIPELLECLAALGVKMSIFSNKLDSFTKDMVHELLGSWTFLAVKGLTSGIPRKPDPTGAVEIARTMQVEPERCVFVGDSGIDMLTGLRSGMLPVGVLWGYQDKETLISNGADTLISDPLDLLALFKK
ncbi:MAG: HAD family hydrolase [Deltaproteobacteria bacterium]|nr:HAD family hydrolase [Deltaproteobacteria bacterium]